MPVRRCPAAVVVSSGRACLLAEPAEPVLAARMTPCPSAHAPAAGDASKFEQIAPADSIVMLVHDAL